MNKQTSALTTEQYNEIITTMKSGSALFHPNDRIATVLVLEGNLGLRVGDIVKLRPCDIINDGGRYRLAVTEQKTGKKRHFTVPQVMQAQQDRQAGSDLPGHDQSCPETACNRVRVLGL